jgi:hypothetical protein
MIQMTQESADEITRAEHLFCEAIDLYVDPETYNGNHCATCIVGQLLVANHLATTGRVPDVLYNNEGFSLSMYEMVTTLADHYGVSWDKVNSIFFGVCAKVPEGSPAYNPAEWPVAHDIEVAKRRVVAAYMNCTWE